MESLLISDINRDFINKLEKFCNEVLKYNTNTTGRFVRFVKGVAVHARDNKGISACYTGQRISDLLHFSKDNIISINGKDLIQINQQKTQKLVSIPIHPRVKEILDTRNGNFPRKISDQKFNKYIKEVCEKAGLNELSKGLKYNIETKKRELGIFPKWELVTSHICRRSFTTNFYGKTPASLIIGITAHSTEKQYLEYVGRSEQDKSLQVADIWEKEELKKTKNIKICQHIMYNKDDIFSIQLKNPENISVHNLVLTEEQKEQLGFNDKRKTNYDRLVEFLSKKEIDYVLELLHKLLLKTISDEQKIKCVHCGDNKLLPPHNTSKLCSVFLLESNLMFNLAAKEFISIIEQNSVILKANRIP